MKEKILAVLLIVVVVIGGAIFYLRFLRVRVAQIREYIEGVRIRAVVRDNGSWEILHKTVNRAWKSGANRFGKITLYNSVTRAPKTFTIDNFQSIQKGSSRVTLTYIPLTNVKIQFQVELVDDDTVRLSYTSNITNSEWSVQSVNILDEALAISGDDAYAVVPARLGLKVPVNTVGTLETVHTYSGARVYNMALLGLVDGSSAVAITWTNIEVGVKLVGTGSEMTSSIILNKDAKEVKLHFIANGDYVDIAKYYREVAKERGLFVTLKEKIEKYPNTEKLAGAVSFKPSLKFGLASDASPEAVELFHAFGIDINPGESRVYWTSDDIAKIAEHFKNDLKIAHAWFIIYGWMKGGQEMNSPEWFPVDEDIGGNSGLADASTRIRSLGYLFSLYTNFFTAYKSKSATDPADARVGPDGNKIGKVWIGGPSYEISPARQLKYAQMNMPTIHDIISPNSAFFDVATVVPVYEDFSEEHPLTRAQTIEKYEELAGYVRSMVNGPLGGEDAYEWNVPFFDAYEGMAYFEMEGGVVIPLFELVFRETGRFGMHGSTQVYVKSEPPWYEKTDLIDLISVGRTPTFGVPSGLYYETEGVYTTDEVYARADNGWAQVFSTTDRLIKNAYEITSPLNELTMHKEMTDHEFLTQDYNVVKTIFGDEVTVVVNKRESDYTYNGIMLPHRGFIINGSQFVAFHAKNYNGIDYSDPPLFTIRSLDNKTIENSEEVRIYHGFGDKNIAIKNAHPFASINGQAVEKSGDHFIFNVEREATVEFSGTVVQAERVMGQPLEVTFEEESSKYLGDPITRSFHEIYEMEVYGETAKNVVFDFWETVKLAEMPQFSIEINLNFERQFQSFLMISDVRVSLESNKLKDMSVNGQLGCRVE